MCIWNGAKMPTIGMIERHCEVGYSPFYAGLFLACHALVEINGPHRAEDSEDYRNLQFNRAQMIATGALPSEL